MSKKEKVIYKTVVEANIQSDYSSDFDHARITFTETLAKRIMKLSAAVASLKAAHITDYDYTPELLSEGIDGKLEEVDVSVDGVQLVVSDFYFWWEGYLKHSDPVITWSTGSIRIEVLEALLIPPGELLLHVGRDWACEDAGLAHDAAKIFKERLANECR